MKRYNKVLHFSHFGKIVIKHTILTILLLNRRIDGVPMKKSNKLDEKIKPTVSQLMFTVTSIFFLNMPLEGVVARMLAIIWSQRHFI